MRESLKKGTKSWSHHFIQEQKLKLKARQPINVQSDVLIKISLYFTTKTDEATNLHSWII